MEFASPMFNLVRTTPASDVSRRAGRGGRLFFHKLYKGGSRG